MSASGKTMGATQILAAALASIDDPHGTGVGADIRGVASGNGVEADVFVPSGDQYRITVEWIGDRETTRS